MGLQPIGMCGMGLKLMGMGWGLGDFCGDGVGMGLMYIVSRESRPVRRYSVCSLRSIGSILADLFATD